MSAMMAGAADVVREEIGAMWEATMRDSEGGTGKNEIAMAVRAAAASAI
jgi:hypothetical protein